MYKNLYKVSVSLILSLVLVACGSGVGQEGGANQEGEAVSSEEPVVKELIVYSGRSEKLVGPVIEMYEEAAGVDVKVKYGDSAQMAALLMEEKSQTPADVFFAQDAGALGAVEKTGAFADLPSELLDIVDAGFKSDAGKWVGVTGRNRVIVYNKENFDEEDLPDDIFGFCEDEWKGRLGWAPTNGSFQSFVTALRVVEGEERTREWLECIQENEPKVYPKNTPIVAAAAAGEIDAGFVNHYYLHRFLAEEGEDFGAANYYLESGDAGALVNVAGVGVLKSSDQKELAEDFVEFLLSQETQKYFAEQTYEYPLVGGVGINPALKPLAEVNRPDIDLRNLDDLQGTLDLLRELNIL